MRIAILLPAFALAARGALPAAETLSLDLGGGVAMELVLVKAGKFLQGSPPGEAGRNGDELQREVTITEDFYLGKFPVTRGQFARFVAETGYRTEAEKGTSGGFGLEGGALKQKKAFTWKSPGFRQDDSHPAVIISFADAQAFAAWLSKKAFRGVMLPTEAQWEYACRGGTATRYYHGDSDEGAGEIAWHRGNSGDGTRPVGQKRANPLGLHDLCGNVHEWCRDWYATYPPGPVIDPEEKRPDPTDRPRRVLRGASFLREVRHCRSAARYRNDPGSRNADNGFRVAASVKMQGVEKAGAPPAPPAASPERPGGQVERPAPPRPAAPPPRPVPPAGRPGPDGGFWTTFIIFAVLLGCFFIALLRLSKARRIGRPATPLPPPETLVPRPVEDGFWVDTSSYPPGTTIVYRCRTAPSDPGPPEGAAPSGEDERTFTVERAAEGQFIYTGGVPEAIAFLEAIAPSFHHPPPRRPGREDREPDSDEPFRGFPSAY